MALEDKEKWDKRHIDSPIPTKPVALVTNYAALAPGKIALDIACGMGRHSRYLATQGFEVDALDISATAINALQNIENIHAKEVDFDTYMLEKDTYDLIVCTYYLERRLFAQIYDALRPGGIFIYESFVYHPDNGFEPSKQRFMLNEGELEATFDEKFELMHIREEWVDTPRGDSMLIGKMVAKKKSGGMSVEDFWA